MTTDCTIILLPRLSMENDHRLHNLTKTSLELGMLIARQNFFAFRFQQPWLRTKYQRFQDFCKSSSIWTGYYDYCQQPITSYCSVCTDDLRGVFEL